MKIPLNLPDEHQYSVMQRVLDGSLAVGSINEFHEILKIYPDDALLYRRYADLLIENHHPADAVQAFDKAARLFIDQGMNLQAIVAKILQWQIEKPTHEQGKQFQKLLSTKGSQHTPLQRLWADMRYPELITIMLRLVRMRLPAGDQITSADDPVNEIYFVVSGTLMETLPEDCLTEASMSGLEIEPRFLGHNDIFGNIFPLEEITVSTTDVSAVTDVELVKIAKPVLCEACSKYPRIEDLLRGIYKPGNEVGCDRPWQTVRRSVRFGVPTRVEIISPAMHSPGSPPPSLVCTGMAVDISSGGMCIDLGATAPLDGIISLKNSILQATLGLKNDKETLNLTGKIVWQRIQETGEDAKLLIGVRFTSLTAADRKLLIDYCTGKYQ